MKAIIMFLVLSFSVSSCTWLKEHEYENDYGEPEQRESRRMEPGRFESEKCYAKLVIQELYETDSLELFEYTGDNPSELKSVKYEIISMENSITVWEKKQQKDCISISPEDCFLWCLVEEPEKEFGLYVVSDTSTIKDFKSKLFTRKILVKAEGLTEWREIICAAKVSAKLCQLIQISLIKAGYKVEVNGKVGAETKAALVNFQKDNGLPFGALDHDTLVALGLEY
ncbi:MAG: hypothetical protein ACJA1A_002561 [Saprospiraceae bacterium]|jgi:hypothetical protein|tara:strand:+ start:129 stop:806 length:678 start_codon:yes stop_codon:yes gene_type:complete